MGYPRVTAQALVIDCWRKSLSHIEQIEPARKFPSALSRIAIAIGDGRDAVSIGAQTLSIMVLIVPGASADYAAKIEPGSLVFVEREISYREYEREVDGRKVNWPITEIIASSISAIHPKDRAERGAAA